MKIAIIGYSGAGKSTLARQLADRIGCEPTYLDVINFLPNWRERNRDEARAMAREVLLREDWVIDGNYRGLLREERLASADQIVFMNYPRLLCLYRALKRHRTYRGKTRESAATGCIERMNGEFVWWILHRGRTRAKVKQYRETVSRYAEKTVVIRNDRQLRAFMTKTNEQTAHSLPI